MAIMEAPKAAWSSSHQSLRAVRAGISESGPESDSDSHRQMQDRLLEIRDAVRRLKKKLGTELQIWHRAVPEIAQLIGFLMLEAYPVSVVVCRDDNHVLQCAGALQATGFTGILVHGSTTGPTRVSSRRIIVTKSGQRLPDTFPDGRLVVHMQNPRSLRAWFGDLKHTLTGRAESKSILILDSAELRHTSDMFRLAQRETCFYLLLCRMQSPRLPLARTHLFQCGSCGACSDHSGADFGDDVGHAIKA